MTSRDQPGLFDVGPPQRRLPDGFRYAPEICSPEEERELVGHLEALPFAGFEFRGFLGKRRVVSYGWRYDFNVQELQRADDIPAFLLPLRARVATFAGLATADAFRHALITEYAPGAGIGWHRDKAAFDKVAGVSLLAACDFRFRRGRPGGGWERVTVVAEPRSAYLLEGAARAEWEHSIPAVDRLRYSITFRTFRETVGGGVEPGR